MNNLMSTIWNLSGPPRFSVPSACDIINAAADLHRIVRASPTTTVVEAGLDLCDFIVTLELISIRKSMRRITINLLVLCLGAAVYSHAAAQFSLADKWWMCPVDRALPVRPLYAEPLEFGSTEIRADTTRIVKDGITQFAGNVEIIRDSRSISGDLVTYDDARSLFDVEGNATIWDSGLIWQGEHALFNLDSDVGRLESGNYWMVKGRGRGFADSVEIDRKENVSRLKGVDYTTCLSERPDWRFSAESITLDHDGGRGSATHAVLKIRDVPVFYVPYISFPLDDRRKSGFLIPTVGSSNESGIDIQIPYYFNLAPNRDATFKPRWMGERGVMLGGEYRYLSKQYKGQIGVEYLPSDKLYNDNARSLISLRHEHFFDHRRGYLEAKVQNVSDAQYFEDFGRSLSVTSQRYLDRKVRIRYRRRGKFIMTGLVQSYQQVDDSARAGSGPYRRLPQLQIRSTLPARHLQLSPQIDIQTTYFDRRGSVSGGRVDITPSISYPFYKSYALITPKLSIRHTEYFLNNEGAFNDRESRTVPVASLDTRLFAERRLSLFGSSMLQTFEPRAFYLYIPKDGQDDIPIFDTGQFDISFRNLFRENRFTGRDRIGDANQLALAATTRLLSLESGRELLRASFGQIYYFEDREINLPGRATQNDDVSELVAELGATFSDSWSARMVIQYDPSDSITEKAAYSVRYRPAGTSIVMNAGYRRRRARTDIEQTDLSFRFPVTSSVNVLGRWNYSLADEKTLELVGGLEFESCCWGMRLVGRRFIRNTAGEFDTGIFMQFELKGLAGYGRGTASFLRKSIPGYESNF
ncbi:MAG: LPS-assembly protein LptD [Proteobacteria bacterium]|nr:MAG: LPS-assembly protein LptD [Pseudomonadota bacterium]